MVTPEEILEIIINTKTGGSPYRNIATAISQYINARFNDNGDRVEPLEKKAVK